MVNSTLSTQSVNLRDRILGLDQKVPLLDGRLVPYVNLDNAASTPPLLDVMEALERFLPYYSSVHRGTGFKSRRHTTRRTRLSVASSAPT
jgi:selenocysteine lyase/cysteine desulfurase